jgi:hypothetical protein
LLEEIEEAILSAAEPVRLVDEGAAVGFVEGAWGVVVSEGVLMRGIRFDRFVNKGDSLSKDNKMPQSARSYV